jgi:hypothetical protein
MNATRVTGDGHESRKGAKGRWRKGEGKREKIEVVKGEWQAAGELLKRNLVFCLLSSTIALFV